MAADGTRMKMWAGKEKLSQNYDPNRDRGTMMDADPNWVAPTSHVGVAQRQEVFRAHTLFLALLLDTRARE